MNELALFAGAGGGILGGKLLGWRTVCAVEFDPYARSVLMARQNDGCLEPFPIWDDVRTFDGWPWRGCVDVVSGGFPCQDISAAGKGAGIGGSRSGLWSEMARIIREVGPRHVLVENSPMLTARGLGRVLGDLAEMGFDARWGVLGADDIGAPHKRKRIWIVADAHGLRKLQQQGGERNERGRSGDSSEHVDNTGHLRGRDGTKPTQTQPTAIAGRGEVADAKGRESGKSKAGNGRESVGRGSQEINVADSAKPGLEGPSERRGTVAGGGGPWRATEPSEGGGEVCDAMRLGQSGPRQSWYASDPAESREGEADWAFNERVGHIWGAQSPVGRVAHGVANRMDRLKAIGNGQVPAVVRLAWNTIGPTQPG